MKWLLLFDIDGTLVRGGPAKEAFHRALETTFGTAGSIQGHDFSGKTDPQIARELLQGAGIAEDVIEKGFPTLWKEYLAGLADRLPQRPMEVIPGVREVLAHLEGIEEVALGLLTGNIIDGARLKLASGDLLDHFPVGGFGSDSEIRNELPAFAMERAARKWGVRFSPDHVVVVGDTPRDVECGKFGGTRTVAVATGRYGLEALREAGADEVLLDMEDLDGTVNALLR